MKFKGLDSFSFDNQIAVFLKNHTVSKAMTNPFHQVATIMFPSQPNPAQKERKLKKYQTLEEYLCNLQ